MNFNVFLKLTIWQATFPNGQNKLSVKYNVTGAVTVHNIKSENAKLTIK